MTAKYAPVNEGFSVNVTIVSTAERQRLDKALVSLIGEHVSALSRMRVQALIAAGHVRLGGDVVSDGSQIAKTGTTYQVFIPPVERAEPEPQKIDLNIVFEDKDILVLDKPVGLVVHPAPGNRDQTLVNALLAHCGKSLSGIGGVARPGIVHRLDKDTSGLMVVAKNDEAHQKLSAQFADRSLSRTYQALVWGVPALGGGTVDEPIGRHSRDRKKMAVTAKGKPALTKYRLVKDLGVVALVECKLATGRTHQIRVHMAHIKHPLVGDPVYGVRKGGGRNKALDILRAFPRQALHAIKLELIHPRTGKTMRFTSELPKDIAGLIKDIIKTQK